MLRDVASLINASSDLNTTLRDIIRAVCLHTEWSMGGIMSIDRKSGLAYVIARHDPNLLGDIYQNQWELKSSPTILALQRNEPVVINDAQTADEFPGYQQEAALRGYRTVAVLPMGCKDAQDRAVVLSVQSSKVIDVTESNLALLQTIVHMGAIAVEKAHRLAAENAFAARLQGTLSANAALMQQVLSNSSVASSAAMIGGILPNPVLAVDLTANLVVPGRSPKPGEIDDSAWEAMVRQTLSRQIIEMSRAVAQGRTAQTQDVLFRELKAPLILPTLIEPLFVDKEVVGALWIFPIKQDFSDLDHLLLDSAKFALSVQMMRHHIRFQNEAQTLSDLFQELVEKRWRTLDDVKLKAMRLGIDLEAASRLVVVGFRSEGEDFSETSLELHRSFARVAQQRSAQATVFSFDNLIVCHLPMKGENQTDAALSGFMRRLIEEARWIAGDIPYVVLSRTCRSPGDYSSAWHECRRLLHLARRFNRTGIISSRDFGPLPVLLSAADTREVFEFMNDAIGLMVRHDAEHGTAYVETLKSYLDNGCRSQQCADALGLHVTTLRYRLTRMTELFGLDIDSPERRFSLELAIRLHAILAQENSGANVPYAP
ncbi:helix-turn-helix domain-containing protein [Microvirga pakistanensis]|uniref:helix-turn-helix domain-containing protein n=1 Tax=Microvirga pakistanensis TaxID=1682650 RepID=UPI00141A86DD|nr:helix-turn-helix domain-containing protein [Microvirga pakistanensis]